MKLAQAADRQAVVWGGAMKVHAEEERLVLRVRISYLDRTKC